MVYAGAAFRLIIEEDKVQLSPYKIITMFLACTDSQIVVEWTGEIDPCYK